jgi:hypothetical protein
MQCTMPVPNVFLRIRPMCRAGDARKLVIFCSCFEQERDVSPTSQF